MSELTLKKIDLPAPPKQRPFKLILIGLALFATVAAVTVGSVYYIDSLAVDRHLEAGYANYDKAFNNLEAALPAVSKLRVGDSDLEQLEAESAKIIKLMPRAQKQLESARREFDLMRVAAFSADDRKVASLSRQSVNEAEKGAVELTAKIGQLGENAESLALVREAADKFSAGFAKNNDAINAGNEDKLEEAARDADEAAKLFAQARSLLARANDIAADPAVTDAAVKLGRARLWAASTKKLIAAGGREQIEEYNKLARDNNKLSDELTHIAQDPLLVNPDQWMREKLEQRNTSIQDAFRRADNYRDQAIELWEQNM